VFAVTFVLSLDLREWTPSRPVSQRDFRQNVETVTAPQVELTFIIDHCFGGWGFGVG